MDAPIIVNPVTDEFYKQPMYYALGHVSRFAPKGSKNIASQLSEELSDLHYTAFLRPDNGVAVVLLNR